MRVGLRPVIGIILGDSLVRCVSGRAGTYTETGPVALGVRDDVRGRVKHFHELRS